MATRITASNDPRILRPGEKRIKLGGSSDVLSKNLSQVATAGGTRMSKESIIQNIAKKSSLIGSLPPGATRPIKLLAGTSPLSVARKLKQGGKNPMNIGKNPLRMRRYTMG